jgi:hypothetical protein
MPDRKFGALAGLKKQRHAREPDAPTATPLTQNQPARGRGRPAGKRSDPHYEATTLLLRKATKKAAFRLLDDIDAGQDLSDLAEELIANWIHRQQQS